MTRQPQRAKARRADLSGRTFVLHISPERAPAVSRTIELRQSDTLADLHDAIQAAFILDDAHPYSFFMSGRAWDPHCAFDGPGKKAAVTTLHEAGLQPGARFLYIFDYGEELRHWIRVESAGAADPAASYPRTLSGVGEPPPQYDDLAEWEVPEIAVDLEDLAREVAQVAQAMEERMYAEEQPPRQRDELLRELALARRLHEALAGRPEQLDAIDAEHDVDLSEWLSELTFTLAEKGLVDEALGMHGAWAALMKDEAFVGDRALLLAHAGRREEALVEARRCAAAAGGSADALDRAAEIFQRCGALEEAERLSRLVLERAKEPVLRGAAADRLIEVLQQTGRSEEAAQMARLHQSFLEEAAAYDLGDDLWDEDEQEDAGADEAPAPADVRPRRPR